jgi:hypothetical protein
MIWLLTFGGTVLAFVVAISTAALVEVFRQLADLRSALNLQDEPTPLGFKTGELHINEIGLPPEIAMEPQTAVVFLSAKCATCLQIAEAFREGSPETVWFVLADAPASDSLIETLAVSADRVIIDENDAIVNRIGLRATPAVFIASYGDITRALAVSSPRQVQRLVPPVFGRSLAAPVSRQIPAASPESA